MGKKTRALTAIAAAAILAATLFGCGQSPEEKAADAKAAAQAKEKVETKKLEAQYRKSVEDACEYVKAAPVEDVDATSIWNDKFRPDTNYKSAYDFTEAVKTCAPAAFAAVDQLHVQKAAAAQAAAAVKAAAEAQALEDSINAAGPVDVDTVVKNPNATKGQMFRLAAHIVQMDGATGPCTFRGEWDSVAHDYNFEYAGDNAVFNSSATGSETTCPIFDGVDQDDTVTFVARGEGTYSYDTQIGGNTTVPKFTVLRVENVVKG